ncbi:MAG: hypothetical protein QNJ88_02605 [Acidimicrobiia bacterium]|nr:hypothetical protein [Acidimicrobiia bacterium]
MIDYPVLWLALEDFVPVVFSAFGLWALTVTSRRLDGRGGMYVAIAFGLIATAGITKPIYKSILALSGGDVDVVWLSDVLFWGLAPGFVLLAAGLRRARVVDSGRSPEGGRWAPPAAAALVAAAAILGVQGSEAWFFVLLSGATVGNVLAVGELVVWSRARNEPRAATLFLGSLLVVFVLAGAAAALEQTIANQWIEQLVSTAGQGMFMVAAFRLAASAAGITGARWRQLLATR